MHAVPPTPTLYRRLRVPTCAARPRPLASSLQVTRRPHVPQGAFAIVFASLCRVCVGLAPSTWQLVQYLITVCLVTLVAESYVICIGCVMPDEKSAAVVAPVRAMTHLPSPSIITPWPLPSPSIVSPSVR